MQGILVYKYGVLNVIGCIIGSFRKYYSDILIIIQQFERSGINILSPKHSSIIRDDNGFVILKSDNEAYSQIDIQTLVFHRAFRSDFIYVWNPDGYVGRTTCYELGRIQERSIPIFYKEQPTDIPIYVPNGSVISVSDFISYITQNDSLPKFEKEVNPVTAMLLDDLKNNKFHE